MEREVPPVAEDRPLKVQRLGDKGEPGITGREAADGDSSSSDPWGSTDSVLYDVLLNIPLDWPSLTVEWLPGIVKCSGTSVVKQRLLVGTHTSGVEPDALVVMQVELPLGPFEESQKNEYKERGDYEGFQFGLSSYKVKVLKRLPHPKESNCARHMPQRPAVIASCTVDGRVLLYDLEAAGICEGPEASLIGHKGEATSLSWNIYREGYVASCGAEGTLAVHDASNALQSKQADLLLAASEDSVVSLWDIRAPPTKSVAKVTCDGKAVNCVATSKLKPELFVCGGDDGVLRLYDRRRLESCAHEMEAHGGSKASVVSFSPYKPSLFLSGGYDKGVSLWDLEQIGADQDPEDAEDGPPELLMVASVADDNKLHIWQPKASVFFDSESEAEDDGVHLE
ncbi:wd g-beta repeat domain-containing protein [Cyclospora cayetanensis]|uniref:Wd g-beta repeat domain-containing protein n=1 Tax=Cyclospora cayetanensis TaxID=88456 RepID=A0A1D3D6I6_9EIME|nr:wd g-beta repeat domain-containing protein [Cyclospora cayetanensis]